MVEQIAAIYWIVCLGIETFILWRDREGMLEEMGPDWAAVVVAICITFAFIAVPLRAVDCFIGWVGSHDG